MDDSNSWWTRDDRKGNIATGSTSGAIANTTNEHFGSSFDKLGELVKQAAKD